MRKEARNGFAWLDISKTDAFWLIAWVSLAAILLVLLLRPPPPNPLILSRAEL